MVMNKDLNLIKKKYGENMMHLCRKLFPTLLEKEGLLSNIMINSFAPSKNLYKDIKLSNLENSFKNYIMSKLKVAKKFQVEVKNTPFELMEQAGYDLFECKTKSDIDKFKKYYSKDEILCTFKDNNRLNTNYIFFAVKKDVDKIKREDFKNPKRQDLYGTSVISIQFSKGKSNYLSIKNRYNHTVNNPDATYSNNLDNIKEGLKYSFEKYYNLNITNCKMNSFEIMGYVLDINNKMYKYYYEINNIYYCENNIIIQNGKVIDKYKDKEKYLFLDYFILDLKNKKIFLYDDNINDSFINTLGNIESVKITNNRKTKEKEVLINSNYGNIKVVLKDNCIVKYTNNNIRYLESKFLYYNKYLNDIELNNVEIIEDCFLCYNMAIKSIRLKRAKIIGRSFLFNNQILKSIYLDNVEKIGDNFLYNNKDLKILKADKLKEAGDMFLSNNKALIFLKLLSLNKIGDHSFMSNEIMEELYMPNIEIIGSNFLLRNNKLKILDLRNVKKIFYGFMKENNSLLMLNIQSAELVYDDFLAYNEKLETLIFGDDVIFTDTSCLMCSKFSSSAINQRTIENKRKRLKLY